MSGALAIGFALAVFLGQGCDFSSGAGDPGNQGGTGAVVGAGAGGTPAGAGGVGGSPAGALAGTSGQGGVSGGVGGSAAMAGGNGGSGGAAAAAGGAAGVQGGSGGTPAVESPYPAGPYGFKVGDTVADLSFKTATGGAITIKQLRARQGVKVLLWSSGAEWCTICKVQAPKLNKLSAAKQAAGLLVFETLHQNSSGGSADAATLQRWDQAFNTNYELFIEQNPNYAGHSDNPLDLIIDAQTMKVRHRQLYSSNDLDAQVDAALANAGK